MPAAPPAGTRTVLLTVGLSEGLVHPDGNAIPVGGTLGLERGLARRRSRPPKYWVLQTAGDENVRYWTPLDPSPRVRVNLPVDLEQQSHLDPLVQMPEMYVALRLPFFPQGTLEFYAADGTPAGSFRFGAEPSSPLVSEDQP